MSYKIYSDGGCRGNPGPGGWGAIIIDQFNNRVELSGNNHHTTNNQMELTGALEGIKSTPLGCTITLTTDSQYVIKGITEWVAGWKKRNWQNAAKLPVKNRELWESLDSECSKRNVTLQWVKGHSGHPENERCDYLANMEMDKSSKFDPSTQSEAVFEL